ncbi:glycoside hydrolase family 9 protein [Candidatus Sumerlaeota bacterium]|nr:glycoside hydrolase family 9 protein [Candidatus Sumerlaeota bacterium]
MGMRAISWFLLINFCFLPERGLVAAPLLNNGGFESPSDLDGGPSEYPQIQIREGDAHDGKRFVHADAPPGKRAMLESPVTADTDYRLEGWLRVPDGSARLAFDLLDQEGGVIASFESHAISGEKEWTYCAVESKLPPRDPTAKPAASARIWLVSEGGADLDDLHFAPLSPEFFANSGMELPADKKGRVPFWTEESAGWPGMPWQKEDGGGKQSLDAENKHGGAQSLKLAPAKSWHATGSINYPLQPWSDHWQGRAWVRCESGARGRVLVVWSEDDLEKIVRVDQSAEFSGVDWTEILTDPLDVPHGAAQARLVLLAQGGSACFDDARLIALPPARPSVKVLVNQVGYDLGGPKSAVIAANVFDPLPARIQILDQDNNPVAEVAARCAGRIYGQDDADWGWYFWRADFSSFHQKGKFKLEAGMGGASGESYPFEIAEDLHFSRCAPMDVKFFHGQRCGVEVPGVHAACHLDDAKMPGGSHRDLTGGWHSAGDYNKLAWEYGDGAATYALASAAQFNPLGGAADEARWGAKYLSKIQIPETGNILGDIWQGPDKHAFFEWLAPDKHTDNQIGTADDPIVAKPEGNTPLAMGGWAAAAKLAPDEALRKEYLECADKMLNFYRSQVGVEANPHVILGALAIYQSVARQYIADYARKGAEALLAASDPAGPIKGGYADSGDVPCAALAAFALVFPKDPLSAKIEARLQQQIEFLLADPENPFGVARQKPGADGFFFEPTSALGQNFLFGAHTWGAIAIYRVTGDRRALCYAVDQLDWVLGKNPYNLCMMEGLGSFNPPRYHSRYDAIPENPRGAVAGAIPNGFVRDVGGYDRPGFDLSRAGRPHPSYRTSEPWLVHNILNLLAVTELHQSENEPHR